TCNDALTLLLVHYRAITWFCLLSLHDALPILLLLLRRAQPHLVQQLIFDARSIATAQVFVLDAVLQHPCRVAGGVAADAGQTQRSEEHTSELQSRENLVCRLLLEKKKDIIESV